MLISFWITFARIAARDRGTFNDEAFMPELQSSLPEHGRIACSLCHGGAPLVFDATKTQNNTGDWRITANPLAWGNPAAEIIVLGFSKGPTQAGALGATSHDQIAYKGAASP